MTNNEEQRISRVPNKSYTKSLPAHNISHKYSVLLGKCAISDDNRRKNKKNVI